MGQFAELAERFAGDEMVEAAGVAGPSDVFVAQRPSILRTGPSGSLLWSGVGSP